MSTKLITKTNELEQLCEHIHKAGLVAFDTEFVSEHTLHPELSLLQFATHEQCVAVDPLAITDLSCWWKIMADEETRVVVHGGQAEVRFCLREYEQPPQNMIDLQIAEGLRSRSYPLGYSTLVQRVINKKPHNKETRTDWKKRPLSSQQIKYALDDVAYVLPVWKKQQESLKSYERLDWVFAECDRLIADLVTESKRPRWERISGIHKLDLKTLGIVREISTWRDRNAEERNRPLRQVLRDDLIIELARMKPDSVEEIQSVRDMTRRSYQRIAPELLEAIQRGKKLKKHELPKMPSLPHIEKSNNEQVISQLLGIALSNRCAEMKIARQLVGTNTDLMQLIRHHYSQEKSICDSRLAEGWRAEVCGNLMTAVLNGEISMRVAENESEFPLIFEQVNSQE